MKLFPFFAVFVVGGMAGFVLGAEMTRRSTQQRLTEALNKVRHRLTEDSELVGGVISVELSKAVRLVDDAIEREN